MYIAASAARLQSGCTSVSRKVAHSTPGTLGGGGPLLLLECPRTLFLDSLGNRHSVPCRTGTGGRPSQPGRAVGSALNTARGLPCGGLEANVVGMPFCWAGAVWACNGTASSWAKDPWTSGRCGWTSPRPRYCSVGRAGAPPPRCAFCRIRTSTRLRTARARVSDASPRWSGGKAHYLSS